MLLESACSCLCATYWSQVLIGEWRCSWSSGDRRCSNYIWLINNSIAFKCVAYIRDLTVQSGHGIASINQCSGVIMRAMASQWICSGADQRKHGGSAWQAFVRGIHRWPVDSPHKVSVTRKRFPFDDVTMFTRWKPHICMPLLGVRCPLQAGSLTYVLSKPLMYCMPYRYMTDRVISMIRCTIEMI